ncbi:MAG TPA: OmpA family protein [Arenimonas sp.]|uniref:OmpA family protein n=1 Tax=Arenimonas sp. TaxID=1872635 RepID=UPI002BF62665|nr:OmpA family protein [Arenimonas sp.]HMB55990.1 OmpA family protein [Arenimonas sp.]
MKKKLLCCALLGAMSMAQSVMAQDYDDRWYIGAGAGINAYDKDRAVADDAYGTLVFGKFITQNVSLDGEFVGSNPLINRDNNRNWELLALSVVGRYHFITEGRSWNPYIAFGLGSQRHRDGTPPASASVFGYGPSRHGSNLVATLGAGIQKDLGRVNMRGELGLRSDQDDGAASGDHFTDGYAGLTFLVPLGAEAAAPPPPPVVEATCADKDDDGDGVNNCNDKCPGSAAGQAIGPDGCPVPLTIDLKGVNFDFDKDTLRPDAVAILDEAVSILSKYPQLRVEVAGHTDSIGTEQYNEGLSQRRAKVVYDYLTGHGIDAGRLVGPNGFGESKPIDDNKTKEGRARNRRTELNVQN